MFNCKCFYLRSSRMAFFRLWLMDVLEDFRDLAALFEPEMLDEVAAVGQRDPINFVVFVAMVIVRMQRRRSSTPSTITGW